MSEKVIFGIDLGTTYSCIAYVDEFGRPVILKNAEGLNTTPSVVYFEGENRVVGREAKNAAAASPDQTVELVKRHMGEEGWRFHYEGVDYSPEEISSYILRKLAADAQLQTDSPVTDVVITCPAYFNTDQREATKKAGEIAGLNVLEVLNEPTAAAIMYGVQQEHDQVVLVYDLGGGTFDITAIEIKGNTIRVIATGGDHLLGGRDWDEAVVFYVADKWMEETGSSDNPLDSRETQQDLLKKVEEAKWTLTSRQEATVMVVHDAQRVPVKLSRDKFDELTAPYLERTIQFTKDTMEEARKRSFSHFDQILLVGGSTRMPQVKARLEQEFGLPLKVVDPDEAVAKGAAIYAYKLLIDEKIKYELAQFLHKDPEQVSIESAPVAALERATKKVADASGLRIETVEKYIDLSTTNVASHSFGVIVWVTDPVNGQEKQVIFNLIRHNDPLPASPTKTFGTYEANQEAVELEVLENSESGEMVDDLGKGEPLGKALLPLPIKLPKGSAIEVSFELNQEGLLHITGREPRSGSVITGTFQIKSVISEEEAQAAKTRRIVIS